ncbi:MAG TPA: hypothetical protein ENH91_12535, partial [Leeuwenhoekiella sp.]|nr:hypothetical protein [Leeuwenhoekiella sp.]
MRSILALASRANGLKTASTTNNLPCSAGKSITTLLMLVCLLSLCACKTQNDSTMSIQVQSPFYVGTYTGGDSQGIYKYTLNPNGKLMSIGLVAKTDNPSFLSFNNAKDVLLAVNENENGTLTSFAVRPDSLEELSISDSGGSYPCFVTTNEDNFVLTANYGSGSVGLLQLNTAGKLSDLLD